MEFLNIDAIYFMLFPLAFLIFLIFTDRDTTQRVFSQKMIERLRVDSSAISKKSRNALYSISLGFMILALSEPVIKKGEISVKKSSFDYVIAIDVSKSMAAKDLYPSRIEVAKAKTKDLIAENRGNKVAILAFANISFIVSPLTADDTSALFLLENLDSSIASMSGTDIKSSIEGAAKILKNNKEKYLVILSDGGDEDNLESALQSAEKHNMKIYSIGIGTKEGAPIESEQGYVKDSDGKIVISKLNSALKELSLKSGGGYIESLVGNDDIKEISLELDRASKKIERDIEDIKDYEQLFKYPLSLALLFLFLGFISLPKKRVELLVILFIFSSLNYSTLHAGVFDFRKIEEAKESYKEGEYKKALDNFKELDNIKYSKETHYNLGNAYYKNQNYKEAIESYEKIETSSLEMEHKKLHNIGNSYMQLGEYDKAKEIYEKALSKKNDEETKSNLELAKRLLEREEEENQEEDNKNRDHDESNQNSNDQKEDSEDSKPEKEEKNSDNKENGESKKDQDSKESGESKESEEQNGEEEQSSKDLTQNSTIAESDLEKREISELESKKWMQILEDTKRPTYLYKIPQSEINEHSTEW